jgi:hypothetical protein
VNSGDGYYSPGDGGSPPLPALADGSNRETPKVIGALSPEWRTTPLWGLRDSSPYMHDGKARTIEEAIGRHGGQAEAVQARFNALTGEEKMRLRKFLLSLAAPPNAEHLPAIPNASRPRRASAEAKTPNAAPSRASITSFTGSTGAF